MAYSSRTLLAALVLASTSAVAQGEVPVIELGEAPVQNPVRSAAPQPVANTVPELTIQTTETASPRSAGYNSNSDLIVLLQQLQDEVRSLRGQLESQTRKIKRMEDEQRDRYRDLDRRISYLMNSAGTAAPATAPRPASSAAAPATAPAAVSATDAPATATADAPAPSTPAASASGDDLKAYQAAFALVRQRAYDEAVTAFTAFISDYPGSQRLANAYYWLGEIYLAQQKLELSRDAFSQVLAMFSDHRKASDAAYKLGRVYSELGDPAKSAEYMDLVLKNYPKSSAARLARDFKPQ